jgi:signal transduction histidine kinase
MISDLLDDIEANLKPIHKHGTRADSIVKSMLQHSRGGTGEMEPNDLNALISEYVNLAFHGMRAGKNPINVDIQTELDEGIGEVPLIAEDFSRVIVNLVNNAFDAMRDKQEARRETEDSPLEACLPDGMGSGEAEQSRGVSNIQNYSPKLIVRTRKVDAGFVVIEIEDNGPGIPDDMKAKVLEPFYTTKKGTEGTGLGLSITHDIINLHGGKVEIESEEGTKTIFRITLNA